GVGLFALLGRGALERFEVAHGLAGLVTLVPLPAAPAGDGRDQHEGRHDAQRAPAVPPCPHRIQFFLFFEIVGHAQILADKTLASSVKSTDCCCSALSWARSHFTLACPFWSSSSPRMTATWAPLASARLNCDLKPDEPACTMTSRPASRSDSASRAALRWAASPWCTI